MSTLLILRGKATIEADDAAARRLAIEWAAVTESPDDGEHIALDTHEATVENDDTANRPAETHRPRRG